MEFKKIYGQIYRESSAERGPWGGQKKIVKKMPTIPHCGIQSAGWVSPFSLGLNSCLPIYGELWIKMVTDKLRSYGVAHNPGL